MDRTRGFVHISKRAGLLCRRSKMRCDSLRLASAKGHLRRNANTSAAENGEIVRTSSKLFMKSRRSNVRIWVREVATTTVEDDARRSASLASRMAVWAREIALLGI